MVTARRGRLDCDERAAPGRASPVWSRTTRRIHLVVDDPSISGDGMVAAGSLAEAVWQGEGMDAAAWALAKILPKARTVGDGVALPAADGEVGLVPEHALLVGVAAEPAATAAAGAVRPGLHRDGALSRSSSSRRRPPPTRSGRRPSTCRRPRSPGPARCRALDASGLRGSDGRTPPTRVAGQGPRPPGRTPAGAGALTTWTTCSPAGTAQDRRLTVTHGGRRVVVHVRTRVPRLSRSCWSTWSATVCRTVGQMLPDGSQAGAVGVRIASGRQPRLSRGGPCLRVERPQARLAGHRHRLRRAPAHGHRPVRHHPGRVHRSPRQLHGGNVEPGHGLHGRRQRRLPWARSASQEVDPAAQACAGPGASPWS